MQAKANRLANPVLANNSSTGQGRYYNYAAGAWRRPEQMSNEEQFKMPDCLKELVDYKNSQDYLMFK